MDTFILSIGDSARVTTAEWPLQEESKSNVEQYLAISTSDGTKVTSRMQLV